MAKSKKDNVIDISLLFSASGTDNYTGSIKEVTSALTTMDKVLQKTNKSAEQFKELQKQINKAVKTNANHLADVVQIFDGSPAKYAKAVKAQKESLFISTGGVEEKIRSDRIRNDHLESDSYKEYQEAREAFYSREKAFFEKLEPEEQEKILQQKLDYQSALYRKKVLDVQKLEDDMLKKPLDNSFKESFKAGLRRVEQRGSYYQGFTGFLSKTLGNLLRGTKAGDVFAAKDAEGNKIQGTGINLGLTAVPVAIGLTKLTKSIYNLGKTVMQAYGEIEAVRTNLGVIYGSKSEAGGVFNEIADYAVRSPFSVSSTAEYATLLKQSGVFAKDLMDTLKMIGDVTGGNEEKMRRVANNYAQIQAATRATARDLREFAMAGIPIYQQIADTLGISVAEVKQLGQEGRISADIIQKTFKRMTGKGGLFEGAIEQGAQTFKAKSINAEDMKQLALAEVGEFYVKPIAMPLVELKNAIWSWVRTDTQNENEIKKINKYLEILSENGLEFAPGQLEKLAQTAKEEAIVAVTSQRDKILHEDEINGAVKLIEDYLKDGVVYDETQQLAILKYIEENYEGTGGALLIAEEYAELLKRCMYDSSVFLSFCYLIFFFESFCVSP